MQKFQVLRTAAPSSFGPRVFHRISAPSRIMRLRHGKGLITMIISFSFGFVLALLYCSHDSTFIDSAKREEGAPLTEASTSEDGTTKSDDETVFSTQAIQHIEQTTVAPKPTLPPYPPVVNDKLTIITPSSCDENAFLIIIVCTTSRNFEARKAIRSSWAKKTPEALRTGSNSIVDFQVFFVLGSDEENDDRVNKEAKQYDDILRGNFFDVYVQNELHTVKTLLGLKWASSVCDPKYILKVTTEAFVNVHGTITWLHSLDNENELNSLYKENLYTGFCHGQATGQAKVIRNPQSPYFIPESQWPDPLLPAYVSGVAIFLSRDVAEKMVQFSREISIIHIEDVFLGVLAQHLKAKCRDEGPHVDLAYTTMLTECEDLHFHVLGSVPPKDMFYLSQNVENLRDICKQ